jgi:uncharacterized C2H2 Zn-finger protein
MLKCPKCNKEIEELVWIETNATVFYKTILDGEDNLSFEQDETQADGENWFQCPECEQELFRESEKAKQFLKGKKITEKQ